MGAMFQPCGKTLREKPWSELTKGKKIWKIVCYVEFLDWEIPQMPKRAVYLMISFIGVNILSVMDAL